LQPRKIKKKEHTILRICFLDESKRHVIYLTQHTHIEILHEILTERTADVYIDEISSLLGISSSSYLRKKFCSCADKTPSAFGMEAKEI